MTWLRKRKPLGGRMTAYQQFAVDVIAELRDYEQDVAAARLVAGLPPLSTADFLSVASEHLQEQFAETVRR